MKIYYYNVEKLSDKSVYSKYYEMMDEDRKNKIDRINQEDKKMQSLAAGILIQHIRKTEKEDSKILIDKYNKPSFEDGKIKFNISHSDKYAVAVVSDYEIGIDTEDVKRKNKFTMKERRIVNTCFAPKEQKYIYDIGTEQGKLQRFFRVWTIKEAYVKMEGTGMIRPFYTFEVDFEEERPKIIADKETMITEMKIGISNLVSVCHNINDNEYTIEKL